MSLKHILLGVLTAFIWGINFVSIKMGYDVFTPFWLVTCRFVFCFFPFIFFVPRPKTPWQQLLKISLFFWLGQFIFTFCGMYRGVPAGLTSVLLQSNVIFTALLAWILLKKKPSLQMSVSLSISLAGIVIIALDMGLGEGDSWIGYAFLLLSSICVAIGNLSLKTPVGENILSVIVWCSLITFIPSCALALYFEGWHQAVVIFENLNLKVCGSVLFTSYISTIVANFIWVYLMRHYEVTKVAPFTLMVPLFGILSSYLLLGEVLSPVIWVASSLVVGGLCLSYINLSRAKSADLTISTKEMPFKEVV